MTMGGLGGQAVGLFDGVVKVELIRDKGERNRHHFGSVSCCREYDGILYKTGDEQDTRPMEE